MTSKIKLTPICMALFFTLALVCFSWMDACAQSGVRQNLVQADQNRLLASYCSKLHDIYKVANYAEPYDYKAYFNSYLQSAYSYAQAAYSSAQSDYNNGVKDTYYQTYNEYVTLYYIQYYFSQAIYYKGLADSSSGTTAFNYSSTALAYLYYAGNLFDSAAIYAGCTYSVY